eukprot:897190_1
MSEPNSSVIEDYLLDVISVVGGAAGADLGQIITLTRGIKLKPTIANACLAKLENTFLQTSFLEDASHVHSHSVVDMVDECVYNIIDILNRTNVDLILLCSGFIRGHITADILNMVIHSASIPLMNNIRDSALTILKEIILVTSHHVPLRIQKWINHESGLNQCLSCTFRTACDIYQPQMQNTYHFISCWTE